MVLTPACYVTLGKSLIFSGLQFLNAYMEKGLMRPEFPSVGVSFPLPTSPAWEFPVGIGAG